MRYIVLGAGAVGSVIGGCLARSGKPVVLVCREEHGRAIQNQGGLRLQNYDGSWIQPIEAVGAVSDVAFGSNSVLFLTVKTSDTPQAVQSILKAGGGHCPVVCFQNTLKNEPLAVENGLDVYGGVVKMTCSFLEPGVVTFRREGELILGRFPRGLDGVSREIAEDLRAARFDAREAADIELEKKLKLLVNLNSTTHAIIRRVPGDEERYAGIKYNTLHEGCEAYRAEGIPLQSPHQDIGCELEQLSQPAESPGVRPASPFRVHNSTWQNLRLGRGDLESSDIHGHVIDLCNKHGLPSGYNRTLLELVSRLAGEKLDNPEVFTVADFEQILAEMS